jgi:hypothetical protein
MSYFHPQRMPVLPARRRAAARRQLEEIVAKSARAGRRARQPALIAAIVIVVGLGAGAAAFVAFGPVTSHSTMRCYSAPSRSAGYYMTVARPGHGTTATEIRSAKATCEMLFRRGFLKVGARVVPPKRPPVRHRVPPLVVCVDTEGTAAVVPGIQATEACEKVGLKAATRQ